MQRKKRRVGDCGVLLQYFLNNFREVILNDKKDYAIHSFTHLFIEDRNHVESSRFFFSPGFYRKGRGKEVILYSLIIL